MLTANQLRARRKLVAAVLAAALDYACPVEVPDPDLLLEVVRRLPGHVLPGDRVTRTARQLCWVAGTGDPECGPDLPDAVLTRLAAAGLVDA